MAERVSQAKSSRYIPTDVEILDEAKATFLRSLPDATLFDALDEPQNFTAASDLTAYARSSRNKETGANFVERDLSPETRKTIGDQYICGLFKDASSTFGQKSTMMIHLHDFQKELLVNAQTLGHELECEMDVRFAVGDPLMRLIHAFDPSFKVCTSVQRCMLPPSLVPNPVRLPPFYSLPPKIWKRLGPKWGAESI